MRSMAETNVSAIRSEETDRNLVHGSHYLSEQQHISFESLDK